MTYNTSFTEGDSITALFTGVNTASDGFFGGILLLGIFIIILIAVRTDDFKIKFATSSFITFIIAGAMWRLAWIPPLYLIISVFLLVVSMFVLIWGRE